MYAIVWLLILRKQSGKKGKSMDANLQHTIKTIMIVIAVVILAYGAYRLYQIAVADATQKIKTGVTEGVEEEASKSMNPLGIIPKLFGQ